MASLQANPTPANPDIDSMIARIRSSFIASLIERSLILESLKAEVNSSQHPERALFAIGEIAHKMAGVAETLGLQRLGALSVKLDNLIGVARSSEQYSSKTWNSVEDVVEDLLDEMEALLDQPES
jgi:HPt (histidine-containing phosphotransfer) domain-containing protein